MQEKSKLSMNEKSDSKYEKDILDGTEDILTEDNLSYICSWSDSIDYQIFREERDWHLKSLLCDFDKPPYNHQEKLLEIKRKVYQVHEAYVHKLRSYKDELDSFLADCYKKMEYLDDEDEEDW